MTSDRPVTFGHVGLQVADLDRSLAFYVDGLGLELVERLRRDDAYLGVVVGHPGVVLDVAVLRCPTTGVLLELLQYVNVDGAPVDTDTANPGTAHTCFVVDDVDATYRRLTAAGYGAVNPPVVPTRGRWAGGRSVYVLDPDEIRVELVQPAPAQAGVSQTG